MGREHDDRIDIRGMVFEWYPPKAQSNLEKHKVSFQEASTIFGDKNVFELPDREHSEDELRFIGVGRSDRERRPGRGRSNRSEAGAASPRRLR